MRDPLKGQEALRRGRTSLSGASYFLTICTVERKPGLTEPFLSDALLDFARDETVRWIVRTAVVMPDHIHLIVELQPDASLSEAIRLFKGRSSVALRAQGLKWQPGYFDHRLRTTEALLPVFLYVFLNPYRAGLIARDQPWPGYFCTEGDWAWFGPLINEDCPFPEWLE